MKMSDILVKNLNKKTRNILILFPFYKNWKKNCHTFTFNLNIETCLVLKSRINCFKHTEDPDISHVWDKKD